MATLKEARLIIEELLELDWLTLFQPQGDEERWGACLMCGVSGKESQFKHDPDCTIVRARKFIDETEE